MPLASIEEAINDFRNGRFVIIVDDEDRENEGDLCIAAQFATPAAINFMTKYGRGLICIAMEGERLDKLGIPMMVAPDTNQTRFGTAFTVSVEAKEGITTGISAYDRARTIQVLIDPESTPEDIASPGHMFPLRAKEGGVLRRAGQTEASVDLARLAGLYPAAVICEIMSEDGTMARLPELEQVALRHDLKIISIADLIAYRRRHEQLVKPSARARLPTAFGEFTVHMYEDLVTGRHHVALTMGVIDDGEPVLVRAHSECLTGDAFLSLRCDCGDQLHTAMQRIAAEGRGVILYMRQEGRGIGLLNKIRAYELQDQGLDTVEANERLGFAPDLREYGIGAQILYHLGVRKMRLLTNNPKKVVGLEGHNLEVVEQLPLEMPATEENRRYLETKRDKLGHRLVKLGGARRELTPVVRTDERP